MTRKAHKVQRARKVQEWLTPRGLTMVEGWARDGLTIEEMATRMGVIPVTVYDWKKKFPQFDEALSKGREYSDMMVEAALYKRATGYETTESVYDQHGLVRETKKSVPPDVMAQQFWLTNRRPQQWRHKREVALEAEVTNPMASLSVEELRKLAYDVEEAEVIKEDEE